jgi:tetrahydromethanopterin S-methyltransferase subunit B
VTQETGSRPVPDPTLLTTEALHREIAGLKELVFQRMDNTDRLNAERFKGIQAGFSERDERMTQAIADNRSRVEDAFRASENLVTAKSDAAAEAIRKSEMSTEKLISNLDARLDDVRDRQRSTEGRGSGYATSWAIAVAIFGMVIGITGVILAVIN